MHKIEYSFIKFISYHFRNHDIQKNEIILLFLVLFLSHSFQVFDNSTGTLTITNLSDYSELYTYKSSIFQFIIVSGILEIPYGAFFEQVSLVSVTVGDNAFYSYIPLATVTLGNSVKTIGDNTSCYCTNLTYTYFYGEKSPTFGSNAFYNVPATSVMTLGNYQNESFGSFNVSKGEIITVCPL